MKRILDKLAQAVGRPKVGRKTRRNLKRKINGRPEEPLAVQKRDGLMMTYHPVAAQGEFLLCEVSSYDPEIGANNDHGTLLITIGEMANDLKMRTLFARYHDSFISEQGLQLAKGQPVTGAMLRNETPVMPKTLAEVENRT